MTKDRAIIIAEEYIREKLGMKKFNMTLSAVYYHAEKDNDESYAEGRPTWEVIYTSENCNYDLNDLVIRVDENTEEPWDTTKGYPSNTSWRAYRINAGVIKRYTPWMFLKQKTK